MLTVSSIDILSLFLQPIEHMISFKRGENVNVFGTRRSGGSVPLEVVDLWALFEYILLCFCGLFCDYGIELVLMIFLISCSHNFNLSITTSKVKRRHTE